jgi:hypothetical protein
MTIRAALLFPLILMSSAVGQTDSGPDGEVLANAGSNEELRTLAGTPDPFPKKPPMPENNKESSEPLPSGAVLTFVLGGTIGDVGEV